MKPRAARALQYAVAVAVVIVIDLIRAYVIPEWSLAHPYLLFYPAILVSGWIGGFVPGVLTSLLAALSLTYLWLPPIYSMRIQRTQDLSGLLVFVAIGFAISLLNEARLQAERRAAAAEEDARRVRARRD